MANDVNIIIRAKNEATAVFGQVGVSITALGRQMAQMNQTMTGFSRMGAMMSSNAGLAGGLEVATGMLRAAKGDTDALMESIERMPFGLGRAAIAMKDLALEAMGYGDVVKEIRRLDAGAVQIRDAAEARERANIRARDMAATARDRFTQLTGSPEEIARARRDRAMRELGQERARLVADGAAPALITQAAAEMKRVADEEFGKAMRDIAQKRKAEMEKESEIRIRAVREQMGTIESSIIGVLRTLSRFSPGDVRRPEPGDAPPLVGRDPSLLRFFGNWAGNPSGNMGWNPLTHSAVGVHYQSMGPPGGGSSGGPAPGIGAIGDNTGRGNELLRELINGMRDVRDAILGQPRLQALPGF